MFDEAQRPRAVPLVGDVTGEREKTSEDRHGQTDDQFLAEHHPGGVEAGWFLRIRIDRIRQQGPGNQVSGGGSETHQCDQAHEGEQLQEARRFGKRGKHHRHQAGRDPQARSPAQCGESPAPIAHQAPHLQTEQSCDVERQQQSSGLG